MAGYNKTMRVIAGKLGIGEETKVLSKAAEFERLLQTKSLAGSNMTDTSKIVICIDLAASLLNVDFDMKTAPTLSGLRPSVYKNSRNIIQNLLDLDGEKLTLATLCFSLQCTSVQSYAEEILTEYQKYSKQVLDLDLPQYICIAVYHACRLKMVKISKSKLIEKSRLKATQWTKLEADWSKFVESNFKSVAKTKKDTKATTDIMIEIIEDQPEPIAEEVQNKVSIEPYEDWKARMLELAYKDLALMQEKEKILRSPRKSPRKNTC